MVRGWPRSAPPRPRGHRHRRHRAMHPVPAGHCPARPPIARRQRLEDCGRAGAPALVPPCVLVLTMLTNDAVLFHATRPQSQSRWRRTVRRSSKDSSTRAPLPMPSVPVTPRAEDASGGAQTISLTKPQGWIVLDMSRVYPPRAKRQALFGGWRDCRFAVQSASGEGCKCRRSGGAGDGAGHRLAQAAASSGCRHSAENAEISAH